VGGLGSGSTSSQLGFSGYGGNSGSGNLGGEPNWEGGGGGAGAGSPGNNAMDGAGAYWGQGATGGYGGNGVMPGWVIGWCSGMFGGGGGGGSGGTDVVYPLPLGGAGGGGNGATNGASGPTAPTGGANHCGAGGGGAGTHSTSQNGANGGSGAVYVRYNHAYSAESFSQGANLSVALGTATNLGLSNVVTDYTVGETVRVRMNVTNGTLSIVSASGTTVTGNNSSSVTLVGSQTDLNTALASATLNAAALSSTQLMIDVDMNPVSQTFGGNTYTPHTNGHFYTFRSIANARVWEALDVAVRMQLGGRQGFLATPTSADEMTVMRTVAGSSSAWLGIADDFQENTFRLLGEDAWGPISTGATGILNRYTNWASNEPNNSGGSEGNNSVGSEDYVQINSGSSTWNDHRPFATMNGALVEFEPKSSRRVHNVNFTASASRTATVSTASNLGLGSTYIGASTFVNDETIVVEISSPVGTTMATTGAATITGSGTRTLTIEGSKTNVNATLNNVTLTSGTTGNNAVTISYRAKLADNGTSSSYKYNAGTGNFYLLRSAMTYASAETDAATLRFGGVPGHMLSPTSAAEQTWLNTNVSTSLFWTALNDIDNEGQWTMRTRDAFQTSGFDNVALPGAYISWATGEPNGLRTENCHHRRSGASDANDASCTTSMASVVEFRTYPIAQELTIAVAGAPTVVTPTSSLTATVGQAYSLTLSATDGASPYTYAIATGALPAGLALSSAGVISGTATDAPQSQAITVRVTDANGATATSSSFTLLTNAATCTTATTVVGGHTVQRFTDAGYCQWQVPAGVTSVDGFVVAGGGGGGTDGGSGGGGGGYHPRNGIAVTPGEILTIRVGDGGNPGIWQGAGSTSGQSSFVTRGTTQLLNANGGQAGVSSPTGPLGGAGGTSTGGFAGGTGGTASNGPSSRGTGGAVGVTNYFLGVVSEYSGGGAGGIWDSGSNNWSSIGGASGGGNSCDATSPTTNTAGFPARVNSGGGGGAGCAGLQTNGGRGGSGIAMIRYTTDALDAFPADITGLQARFVADDYQTLNQTRKTWVDSSNNARHVTTVGGLPAVTEVSGFGSSKTVRTLWGGLSENLTFDASVIANGSTTYTLFHLARYVGPNRARIFTSSSGNWLSGFWDGRSGVAHHNSWLTSFSSSNASTSSWVLSSDQNTLYRANGRSFTSASPSAQSFTGSLGINTGFTGLEYSHWQVPEVIVYNRLLSATEIRRVESYLTRTYGLLGHDSADVAQGVLSPRTVAAARTGNASTGSSSQLSVSWTAPTETTGITDYKVEYKAQSDTIWSEWSHTASASLTGATLTGLTGGTTYDIRVSAVEPGVTNRPSVATTATTWGASSIQLTSVPASPKTSTTYTLVATVSDATGTSGTVAFMENGVAISGCATKAVVSGLASCSWTPATLGARSLTASFTGDANFLSAATVSASSLTVESGICTTTVGTTGRFTFWQILDTASCELPALPAGVESIDTFVVGGGGGGGSNVGSGGAGGGAYFATNVAADSTDVITVTVGAGGRAGGSSLNAATADALRDGGAGGTSSISWDSTTFSGAGGAGGQTYWSDNTCNTGGSRVTARPAGGSGTGTGGTSSTGGSGGLGSAVGGGAPEAGGTGFSNSITGSPVSYGGAGGGGGWNTTGGAGGTGGGAAGGTNAGMGSSGTANTGGGGGGGGSGSCPYGGQGGSGRVIVRFANTPTITTQPVAASKTRGQSHTFSVTPSATGAIATDFTYQWKKDGVAISGAISSTYTIASLSTTDAGDYSVTIKSSSGGFAVSSVESSSVALSVDKATQSITFGALSSRTYGDAAFSITATASSGLLVGFASSNTSVCSVAVGTVSGGVTTATVTLGVVGSCVITASQAGGTEFFAATAVTQTLTVTRKTLTLTGLVAANKEYSRTDTATVVFDDYSFGSSVVGSDAVSLVSTGYGATFSDRNVANGKTVTVTGLSLSGAAADNYQLPSPITTTANITAKGVTVNGAVASNKEYDGTRPASVSGTLTLSGVISGDTVTVDGSAATGTFNNEDAGNTKPVTVTGITIGGTHAGNYALAQPTGVTANITAKQLTVTGLSGVNKYYDGTRTASFSGTPALSGVVGSDNVTVSTLGATAAFGSPTAGSSKPVTLAGVTISGTDANNYTVAQPTVTAQINAAPLTINSVSVDSRPFNGNRTASLSDNSAALVGVVGQDNVTLAKGGAAATFDDANVGTNKPVTVTGYALSGDDAVNYSLSQPTGLTANITAAGAGLTWATPVAITYGTTLSSTQLDAEAAVGGTFAYTPDTGVLLTAGTHTLSVTFTPTSSNYAPATATVTFLVNQKNLTVTASSHFATYGDAAPSVSPSYSGFVNSESASVFTTAPACTTAYTNTTPVASSGIATTCSGAVAANYSFTYSPGAITINRKGVVVTASSHTVTYGDVTPTVTPSYSGFVNSQTSAVLTVAPTCSTDYTTTTPFASSGIATACSAATAANYSFSYVDGAITINRKGVVVTASSHSVTYGDVTPTVTPSYSGFVNSQTSAVFTTAPTCSTEYTNTTPFADSGIATTCLGAAAANYSFTYNPGAITINRKGLTVTASSHTVTYGDATPTVTPSYSGFVNSQTAAVFTTAPTCTTAYTNTTPVSSSGIATTCSGAVAANYSFTYNPGAITINRKGLTVTASSHTVTYGDATPTVTPSYSGFVNSQTAAVFTTAPTCTTAYTNTTPVSSSGIATTCSGAVAANYSFNYTAGAITINRKGIAVTASSHTVTYGDATPTVTPSYSNNFVNNQTSAVLTSAPTCSTDYTTTTPFASSGIATTCSGATAANYSFTYLPGEITISRKGVVVTASSHPVVYGDSTPTVSPSYSGFVNSQTSSVLTTTPTCITAYTNTTPVASSGIATTCSGAVAANYSFTYSPGEIIISRKGVVVTASSHTVTYGDATPTVTPSYSGFVNSQTASVLTATPTCSTDYTNTTPFADSGIATTCAGAAAANYSFTYSPGVITINRKGVVVTASSHTVTYGDATPTVTPSYSGFVNSQTASVLTATPTCSTDYTNTTPFADSGIATTCAGAAAANYSFTYSPGAIAINKKSLTVTASSPAVPYGSAVNTVTVTPQITGFVNSETQSVVNTMPSCTTVYAVTSLVGSAPYTRCSGGLDNNYAFEYFDGAVDVVRAQVTITADYKTAIYGVALGQSVTVNGLANSDAVLSVVYTYEGTGQTTYAASTTRPVNVGTYSITPSSVTLSAGSASNYSFHYAADSAVITQKGIVVTASSPMVTYGDPIPTVTPSYSNDFEYGDTSLVVSGTACTTTYAPTSNVGSLPGTSCSGATADNYSFTYVAGAVNVTRKPVIVTASSDTVTYGDATPTVTPSYSGFVNSQTASELTTAPTCSTTYTNSTSVSSSGLATTCSGAAAANYSFTYDPGAIIIDRKSLVVTASSHTVTYGDATPTVTPSYSGFVNSQTASVLTTAPTCSTTYTNSTSVSSSGLATTCSGVAAANYSLSYATGIITIMRAEQSTVTVSATDTTITWQPGPNFATTTLVGDGGDGDGAFTYVVVASTSTVCSIDGSTLTALTAGVCKVTATKAASVNFDQKTSTEFSYTINRASQAITFNALSSRTYGDGSFVVTATATSGLTVAFAANTSVCAVGTSTLSGGVSSATVTIVSAGSCVLTASQSGTINYLTATAQSGSALSRTFTIAPKNLTIAGATASNKFYDGSDTASGSLDDASLDGIAFSDDVSIALTGFTARFSNANAQDNKLVTFASVTLQGSKAANYTVTQPTAVASINQATSGLAWSTPTAVVFGTTLGGAQLNATAVVDGAVVYSPTPGTRLNAGNHTLSVTFTPSSNNYAIETRTVTLRVNKKSVVISATDRDVVYGNTFTSAFTNSDLVGSDTTNQVVYTYAGTGSTAYPASTTSPVNRGSYSITPSALTLSVGDINNYEVSYIAGVLTITQAQQEALAVAAASSGLTYSPSPSPATTTLSMPAGSAGSGTGVVTYSVVTGNTVCSISESTVTALTAGECTVAVTRAADLNFFTKTSQTISITIARATQQVTFAAIDNMIYGDNSFAVSPTATSGLTVAVSSLNTSVCEVPTPLTIRLVSVGTCTIVAAQAGDINYLSATAAAGSNLMRSFTVSQKMLTLSGVTTVSREYDGSLFATNQLRFGAAQFVGVVGADDVSLNAFNATGSFATKTVAVNKPVTVGGLTLSGSHAHRYTLAAPVGVVGTITQAPLSTVGVTVAPRRYNGDADAIVDTTGAGFSGVVAGDSVTFVDTNKHGRFDDALVGDNKFVTVTGITAQGADGGNYRVPDFTVRSSILLQPLTVTGVTTSSREYNGFSNVNATSIVNLAQAQLNGVVQNDGVSLNINNATATFTTGAAEANKTITVSGVTISGPAASNYDLMAITVIGSITQKALTVSGVVGTNHVYNGSIDATSIIDMTQATLVGVLGADSVEVSSDSMQAEFVTPVVEANKPVAVSGLVLTGLRAANYSLVQPSITTDIVRREVSVTGFTVASREYNGTVGATALVNTSGSTLINTIDGDDVAVATGAATAAFATKSVGTNKVVTLAGFALTGTDSSNYRIRQPSATASITARALTVSGITAADKIFDGTTGATISVASAAISGVLDNDVVVIDTTNASGSFADARVGSNKTVRISGVAVTGLDGPNYVVTQPTTTATIITAVTVWMDYRAEGATSPTEQPVLRLVAPQVLPPAPARVSTQSVSGGRSTRVTAMRAVQDAAIPVTHAIITVQSNGNRVLARINVRVDPTNPTTSVTVPYARRNVRVSVQFANDIGISKGGPSGVNVTQGNTFEWAAVDGQPQIRGIEVPGSLIFDRGSSTLTNSMKETLKKTARTVSSRGGLVYVTGYAQNGEIASAWRLESLAQKRAEVVAKYLTSLGVRQWVTFQGHAGVRNPWNTARERRVAVSTEPFYG
jgi:outer membrane protein OmpA-like peptidoglycan-associated protein